MTDKRCNGVNQKYVWSSTVGGTIASNNAFYLPKDLRCCLIGKSSAGKTTLLLHMLLEDGILDWDNLILCGKSHHQLQYKVLIAGLAKGFNKSQIRALFEQQKRIDEFGGVDKFLQHYEGVCKGTDLTFKIISDLDELPDPSELDAKRKNILILDDVMTSPKQHKAQAYFCRGRHSNCSVFFIAQNYFRLNRSTIRENSNLFIFFSQDRKNLIHIYQDHCSEDELSFSQFSSFCNRVWRSGRRNFVVLDTTRQSECGKFRKNLTGYWSPQNEQRLSSSAAVSHLKKR